MIICSSLQKQAAPPPSFRGVEPPVALKKRRALLAGKLAVVQLGVEPAFFQKFLMASLLHDVPIAHDKDLIRLPDGGKAVRHA